MTEENHQIHPDLQALAYPIDQLELLPGNPRRGNVEAVMASYRQFGQRKTIVARLRPDSTVGEVLAGNTQLQAARRLGWTHIAVTWVEDDDDEAAAFALADNRTSELGDWDEENLLAMINQISDNMDLMEASGYDLADEQELMERLSGLDDDISDLLDDDGDDALDEPTEPRKQNPVIQYTIIFDDESQQQLWFNWLRGLKRKHPDCETTAERLAAEIVEVMGGE